MKDIRKYLNLPKKQFGGSNQLPYPDWQPDNTPLPNSGVNFQPQSFVNNPFFRGVGASNNFQFDYNPYQASFNPQNTIQGITTGEVAQQPTPQSVPQQGNNTPQNQQNTNDPRTGLPLSPTWQPEIDTGVPGYVLDYAASTSTREEAIYPQNQQEQQEPQEQQELNIFNPYGGLDTMGGFAYGAYQAGRGKAGQAALGFGRGLLGLGRTVGSAWGAGTNQTALEEEARQKEMSGRSYQTGGVINTNNLTISDFLTGNFITDSPNPNVEIEKNEYTYNSQTGQIQKAVGETHENGGIPVNLPNESQVLSDHTKIGAKKAKEIGKELNVKLKAKDTYAEALDKFNRKTGLNKVLKEESEYIEKTEEVLRGEETDTKALNLKFLQDKFQKIKEEKSKKEAEEKVAFNKLFEKQEEGKPKGEVSTAPIMQEGGQVDPQQILEQLMAQGMSEEEAIAYMEQQMSQPQEQDIVQQAMQALQQGANPEEVLQFLVENGIPQEQAVQIVETAIQQMQNSQQDPEQILQELVAQGYSEDEALQIMQEQMTQMQSGGTVSTSEYLNSLRVLRERMGIEEPLPEVNLEATGAQKNEEWAKLQQYEARNFPEQLTEYYRTGADVLTNKHIDLLKERLPEELKTAGIDINKPTNSYTPEERLQIVEQLEIPQDIILEGHQDNIAGRRFLRGRPEATTVVPKRPQPQLTQFNFDNLARPTTFTGQAKTNEGQATTNDGQAATNQGTVIPMIPPVTGLMPSAMQMPRYDQVAFGREEAVTRTPETQIAANQATSNFAIQQAYANNPYIASFLAPSIVGQAQQANNQAIAEVDAYNAEAMNRARSMNNQIAMKEDLTNIQLAGNYEQRLFQSQANQESAWNRWLINQGMQNKQNWMDINNLNLQNAMYDNFKTDGSGVRFMNPATFGEVFEQLTKAEQDKLMEDVKAMYSNR